MNIRCTLRFFPMLFLLGFFLGCDAPDSSDAQDGGPVGPHLEIRSPDSICYYPAEGSEQCFSLAQDGTLLLPENMGADFQAMTLSVEERGQFSCKGTSWVAFDNANFEHTGSVWIIREENEVKDRVEVDRLLSFAKVDEKLFYRRFMESTVVLDEGGYGFKDPEVPCKFYKYITLKGIGTILLGDDADDYLLARSLGLAPWHDLKGKLEQLAGLEQVTQNPEAFQAVEQDLLKELKEELRGVTELETVTHDPVTFQAMKEANWQEVWQGPKTALLIYAEGSVMVIDGKKHELIHFSGAPFFFKKDVNGKALYTTPEFKDQIAIVKGPTKP